MYSVWKKLKTHSEVSSKHFWYSPHWLKYSALQVKRSVSFFSVCLIDGLEGLLLQLSFSTSLNLASTTLFFSYWDQGTKVSFKEAQRLTKANRLSGNGLFGFILTGIFWTCVCLPFLSSMSRMKRATHLLDRIARRKAALFLQFSSKYTGLILISFG